MSPRTEEPCGLYLPPPRFLVSSEPGRRFGHGQRPSLFSTIHGAPSGQATGPFVTETAGRVGLPTVSPPCLVHTAGGCSLLLSCVEREGGDDFGANHHRPWNRSCGPRPEPRGSWWRGRLLPSPFDLPTRVKAPGSCSKVTYNIDVDSYSSMLPYAVVWLHPARPKYDSFHSAASRRGRRGDKSQTKT